jgi:hypothetical protein
VVSHWRDCGEGRRENLDSTGAHAWYATAASFPAIILTISSDGGENMVLRLNGEIICDSRAEYRAESVAGHGGSDGGMEGMISNMRECLIPVDVKKGDKLSMEAHYDMNKHPA